MGFCKPLLSNFNLHPLLTTRCARLPRRDGGVPRRNVRARPEDNARVRRRPRHVLDVLRRQVHAPDGAPAPAALRSRGVKPRPGEAVEVEQNVEPVLKPACFQPLKPECDLIPFKFFALISNFRHYNKGVLAAGAHSDYGKAPQATDD